MLLLALCTVTSCSSDGWAPPEPIGYAGPARPPRHELVLEGRVGEAPDTLSAREPLRDSEASFSYMETPNLAGRNQGLAEKPMLENAYGPARGTPQAVAAATSEPLYAPQPADMQTEAPSVGEEGIDIDAELGVADAATGDEQLLTPAQAQAQAQAQARLQTQAQTKMRPRTPPPGTHFTIAEENPSQPVVDGIGTDAPMAMR